MLTIIHLIYRTAESKKVIVINRRQRPAAASGQRRQGSGRGGDPVHTSGTSSQSRLRVLAKPRCRLLRFFIPELRRLRPPSCYSSSSSSAADPPAPMASSAVLEDVPNDTLFHELMRRMKCASKQEKRVILVGKHRQRQPHFSFVLPPPPRPPPMLLDHLSPRNIFYFIDGLCEMAFRASGMREGNPVPHSQGRALSVPSGHG